MNSPGVSRGANLVKGRFLETPCNILFMCYTSVSHSPPQPQHEDCPRIGRHRWVLWSNYHLPSADQNHTVSYSDYLVWWGFVSLYYSPPCITWYMSARTSFLATHQECFHDDGQVLQPVHDQLRLQEHHLSPPYNSQQMKLIRMDISDNQPVWFGIITKWGRSL